MCKEELLFHLGEQIQFFIGSFRTLRDEIHYIKCHTIYRSAYSSSKHALQAWYDTARAELYDKNIKFTVVNPGYIKTALSLNALTGNGQIYGSQ